MSRSDLTAFRRRVREAHSYEFALHHKVASIAEQEIIARPRAHPDRAALALDMLMVQGHKAHISAAVLGEHGHIEDTATMVRRLLELAMQSIYIGGDSEQEVREQRASDFIAFLWDSIPAEGKKKLPTQLQGDWEELARPAADRKPNKTRWGPRFDKMFKYAEHFDTYQQDYKLLSALAHGSSGSLVLQYSQSPIPVHSAKQVGALLIYASRYYLGVLDHWLRLYAPALYRRFDGVSAELREWKVRDEGDGGSDE